MARFLERLEPEILALERELREGSWRPGVPFRFEILDPKRRTISAAPFRDRVVHHALIDPLEPVFERRMIHESFACRRGKGTHAALAHARRMLRRHDYFLKLDVRKCFESIQGSVVTATLERILKDRRVLALCRTLLAGEGLPIGNLTSQWFANLVLDRLDHHVKERLRIPGYARYMDDLVLFASDRARLAAARGQVAAYLSGTLGLRLKERGTILAPASEGLPFLGWRVYRGVTRLRPANLRRTRLRLHRRLWEYRTGRIDEARLADCVRSIAAHLEHGDTRKLRNNTAANARSARAVPGRNPLRPPRPLALPPSPLVPWGPPSASRAPREIEDMSRHPSPRIPAAALAAAVLAAGLAASPASAAGGANPSYLYRGERIELERVPGAFVLGPAPAPRFDAAGVAQALGVERGAIEELAIGLAIARVPSGRDEGAVLGLLRGLPGVASAQPLVRYRGRDLLMDGTFFVGGDPTEAARRTGASITGELWFRPGTWKLALPAGSNLDLLEAVRIAASLPGVRFAEPRFYWHAALYTPNDPLYPDQWDMENTASNDGTPDADIDADLAWDLTLGDPSITIAIVDEGVDVDHEDLAANMLPGYDATDQAPPEGQPGNAECDDGHGTSCAGIAAAAGNNALGGSGTAPGCKILPVRIARDSVWTTNEWAADGLTWAYQNGADVLSNSWGGGAPSDLITTAIEEATTIGRAGLGSAVCFASGNSNGAVIYPGLLAQVIAVGASSPCDERKDPGSCDGESWWGSCHGIPLDVVAPGVKIRTTDIMGGCGYTSGNYITNFNGTSSACPHAAGVCALILSVNPGLDADQVQAILELTAEDEVGYPSEDVPGWDQWMGWGRINARAAVDLAQIIDAPSVSAVSPGEGRIRGITQVTITGDLFYGDLTVRVNGIESPSVTRIDTTTIQATVPQGEVLGPVDVQVENVFGTGVLPGGFTYLPDLVLIGTPSPGAAVEFAVSGPPLGDWGLVLDLALGPKEKKGVLWAIAFSPDVEVLANSLRGIGPVLNGIGQGSAPYTIPGGPEWIGVNLYLQAAFDGNGPLAGFPIVLSDLLTVTIEP